MKSIIALMFILMVGLASQAQTYINILDGTHIRVTGGSTIVLNSSAPNSIIKSGSLGGIITDTENDKLIWNVGTSTGVFMVPFCSSLGNTIPFTYTITTAGVGSGVISFSSYETTNSNTPLPTSVVAIQNDAGSNNSAKVIDRFWLITPNNYTTKPEGQYIFTYDDNDLVGNTITESSLMAQRWNSSNNKWGDWLYSPNVNTITNTLSLLIQNPEDQYPVWTLVDAGSPLPIELANFYVNCNYNTIHWYTYSETNSESFILQGSNDANIFVDIDTINGAGNSNQLITYDVSIETAYDYYRLKHNDFDCNFEYSDVIAGCQDLSGDVILYPNPNYGSFNIRHNSVYKFTIYDGLGNVVFEEVSARKLFNIEQMEAGEYYVNMTNENNNYNLNFIKIK